MSIPGLYLVDYFYQKDTPFRAHVFLRGDTFVTIISALTDNGVSLQNVVERLATQIRTRLPQNGSFIWIQHDIPYKEINSEFTLVFFDWNGAYYSNPTWSYITLDTVSRIVGHLRTEELSTLLNANPD